MSWTRLKSTSSARSADARRKRQGASAVTCTDTSVPLHPWSPLVSTGPILAWPNTTIETRSTVMGLSSEQDMTSSDSSNSHAVCRTRRVTVRSFHRTINHAPTRFVHTTQCTE